MAYCKTEGIVLKRSDFSETSQIVTLFTRDYGLIRGIGKGAKRLRKGIPNTLDALTRVQVVFLRKPPGQLHLLSEWTVVENFLRLRQNLDNLYYAVYVSELMHDLTAESEESGELYSLLLRTLKALARRGDAARHSSDAARRDDAARPPDGMADAAAEIVLFEIELLVLLGHMPEVTRCVVCGRSLPPKARFSPRDGGALCSACPATGTSYPEVSSGCLATIATVARGTRPMAGGIETNLARRLKIPAGIHREIRSVLRTCFLELLGREPRMWRFLPLSEAEEAARRR